MLNLQRCPVASFWPSHQVRQASHRSPATAAVSDAHAGRVHDGPLTTPAMEMLVCGRKPRAMLLPPSSLSSASSSARIMEEQTDTLSSS